MIPYDICLSLSDFTKYIHVAANGIISLFLIFHYIYALWLLYPFIFDGHLGFFRVLAIVKSTAVNISVHVSLRTMAFSDYMPRSGIARLYSRSISAFYRTSILFSTVAVPIYIPTHRGEGFLFLYTLCSILGFDDGHSDWCELIPHFSFDLCFSDY